jgi:hypothetical protein
MFYSQRTGTNPKANGINLGQLNMNFLMVYQQLVFEGYFLERFGTAPLTRPLAPDQVKSGDVLNVGDEMLLMLRKGKLWPIDGDSVTKYDEDDLFDVIEFLFCYVSKPVKVTRHPKYQTVIGANSYLKAAGQTYFRERINLVLTSYKRPHSLNDMGQVSADAFQPLACAFRQVGTALLSLARYHPTQGV